MSTTVNNINTQYLPSSFVDSSGNLTVPESLAKEVASGVQARLENMPPAEQRLFLAMLKSADLAPTNADGEVDVTSALNNLEGALDGLEGAADLLAQIFSGSTIDLLSRALVEMAGEQRKQALESRLAAREAAKTQLEGQADAMRDAAAKMIAGAIVAAVLQIVAAAVSIGASMGALGALKTGGDIGRGTADAYNAIGGALKGIGDAAANAFNSSLQAAAKIDDAEGTDLAAEAEQSKATGDLAKEVQDAVTEMIRAIINFLKELKDTQAQQMQSLTRL